MRAFRLAYDGRPYRGFQRQPDVPTVEGALLDALGALGLDAGDGDPPPGYAAAGRTDAGVSAVAQTVALESPDWLSPAALNGELPADVRAWAAADAPSGFHARHDAARRVYTYFLHAPPDDPALDEERARAALGALAGHHDFHNLTSDDAGTVRDLAIRAARDGPFLTLEFAAGGFARQLVRRAVGLVRAVAAAERDPGFVDRVLGSDPLDGPEGVAPAPADPLVLTAVEYPGLDFAADPGAVGAARATFRELRVDRLARARVAGAVADRVG